MRAWSTAVLLAAAAVAGPAAVDVGAAQPPSVSAISVYQAHSCALVSGGAAECWGLDEAGELGNVYNDRSLTPIVVGGVSNAIAIGTGNDHTCALNADGTAACWGSNQYGALGNGATTYSATPVAVSGLTNAISISAGYNHTCVVLAGGTAECWGYNALGQLGNGTTNDSSTPVVVSGLSDVIAISSGLNYTCALRAGGTVACWGSYAGAPTGNRSEPQTSTPVAVGGVSRAIAISAGWGHVCAVLADRTAECWSSNRHGQLGNGTTTDSATPVAVSGLTDVTAISAGAAPDTCAVVAGGTVKCWGYNADGELGNGSTTQSSTPVTVRGITDAIAVSAGSQHTCAVLSGGGARCWGTNEFGQLGNGKTGNSSIPVAVVAATLPAPVFRHSANVQAVSGTVLIRLSGTAAFVPLTAQTTVPVGTTIDTTQGRVKLSTARDTAGHAQSGLFEGGIFTLQQKLLHAGKKAGLTILKLAGPLPSGCTGSGAAASSKHRHGTTRRLWGDAKGNYRSVGRYGAATVGGTKWLTQDTCAGTLVRVARGIVSVNDFAQKRTVPVKAPDSYLAHR